MRNGKVTRSNWVTGKWMRNRKADEEWESR